MFWDRMRGDREIDRRAIMQWSGFAIQLLGCALGAVALTALAVWIARYFA